MREYLLRGGFFMCDDFHGTVEWDVFAASMRKVFPDRPIVEIDNSDPIFHTIYDLDASLPGARDAGISKCTTRMRRAKRQDSRTGAPSTTTRAASWWPCAITWTWAIPGSTPTTPNIPRAISDLGIRIGVNYIVYSMTH